MRIIKLGLIGCGHWGPNYIRAFQRVKGTSLEYACDIDKSKLQKIKEKYPYVITTTDPKEIIDNPRLDAVVIATPAKTHYTLVKRALNSSKHVLVEKPLTLSVHEAEELIQLSEQNKKILMPGHIFEHHDGIKEIKKYIKQKKLGTIYYMYSRRTNLGPIRDDVNAIWDLALHDISIFNFVFDAIPVKARAHSFPYLRGHIEDVGFITLQYPKNIVSHIHVSWLDPRKIREIVIVGSKRMLMFDDLDFKNPIRIYDKRVSKKRYSHPYYTFGEFKMLVKDGQVFTPEIKMREPLLLECKAFIRCIASNAFTSKFAKRGLDAIKAVTSIQYID